MRPPPPNSTSTSILSWAMQRDAPQEQGSLAVRAATNKAVISSEEKRAVISSEKKRAAI